MMIFLNGKEYITNAKNISQLLLENKISSNKVAVEANLNVIPRSTYDDYPLTEGVKIEIITFVGGG